MPTNKTRTILTLTLEELEKLKKSAAKAKKSLNNYIRNKLNLPDLKHGGKREKADK